MTQTLIKTENQVFEYTKTLCEALELDFRLYMVKMHRSSIEKEINSDYHKKCLDEIVSGTYNFKRKFEIESGKKYLKVIMVEDDRSRSVHCFVDKNTGDVYKSASWKSPAKGVRFNLLDDASRDNCYRNCDWSGGYLYLR